MWRSEGIAPQLLTLALNGGEWSASGFGRLTPGEIAPRYPLDRRLGGPNSRSERYGEGKNLALHFTIWFQMSVRLSATPAASLNGCGGPLWDMSRRALNLMEDILSTYYKCTLSAITRIKCFRTHVVFVWGTRAKNLSVPFGLHILSLHKELNETNLCVDLHMKFGMSWKRVNEKQGLRLEYCRGVCLWSVICLHRRTVLYSK
jgi:hypothetical protein